METETEKIIKQQLEYIPEEMVALFADSKTTEKISEIGKIAQLNDDQLEIFQTETSLLMLGLTKQDEYENELKNKLALSEEKFNGILKEIYTLIPADMIEELKIIYDERDEEASEFDPRFYGLSEKVQIAIANSNWKENLFQIAGKYKLTIPQMGILEKITTKVMTNEIRPENYENELASKITIPKEDISNLVNDVNNSVLVSIREILKDNGGIKIEGGEEIPLPPYAKTITNDQPAHPHDNSGAGGLVINNEKKTPETYKPTEIPIENISEPKEEPVNIIESKLKEATISDHGISDYSTPKINPPADENSLPRSYDPYREVI